MPTLEKNPGHYDVADRTPDWVGFTGVFTEEETREVLELWDYWVTMGVVEEEEYLGVITYKGW